MLEKVEDGASTLISSSDEYETLRQTAKANFRASLSEALGYFAAAAQKGGEIAMQIQSMSSNNSSYGGTSTDNGSQGSRKSSSRDSSSGNNFDLSEQQHYNRDKSTYNRYDSMLAKAFAGNGYASPSEIADWQNKMRQIRQKRENNGRSFPHFPNEDR